MYALLELLVLNWRRSERQVLRRDDSLDDKEEDPFTAKMSFEVRRDREDEVINTAPTEQTSRRGWKDGVHNIMRTRVCVCPNSRGARTLFQSRWVARCSAQWAEGMSWSNAGPGHSNGNTSAPCCLMWASPCAPPASRYCVYETHSTHKPASNHSQCSCLKCWFRF